MTRGATPLRTLVLLLAGAALAGETAAMDWPGNALNYRVGDAGRAPYNPNRVSENLFALTHAGSRPAGSAFNLELLLPGGDLRDFAPSEGADDSSMVYRHTFDIGKVRGNNGRFAGLRGVGATVGVDWGRRDEAAFTGRRQTLAAGPTLMWDVPGFLNTSVLLLHESSVPGGVFLPASGPRGRAADELYPMLGAAWAVPVSRRWAFEGVASYVAARGQDDTGADMGPETAIDMQLMFDASAALGYRKNAFRIGVEYQYGSSKFGNTSLNGSGRGFRASTPMLRAEYHFR